MGMAGRCGKDTLVCVAQTLLSVLLQGAAADIEKPAVRPADSTKIGLELDQHRQECLCHTYAVSSVSMLSTMSPKVFIARARSSGMEM
jgi:hypothetical protein